MNIRPVRAIVAAIAAVLVPLSASAGPVPKSMDRLKRNVAIEGQRVQVMVKGQHARAHLLGWFKPNRNSPEIRELLRRATRQVTGCEMQEPYFRDIFLEGTLECPSNIN